jgi:hypothetical protein
MLGLDDLEVEIGVLDLIPAEILGREETGHPEKEEHRLREASQHGDLS